MARIDVVVPNWSAFVFEVMNCVAGLCMEEHDLTAALQNPSWSAGRAMMDGLRSRDLRVHLLTINGYKVRVKG